MIFSPFKNTVIMESIKNIILSSKILEEFNEESYFIKSILINMLDSNYNKRLTFEELKIESTSSKILNSISSNFVTLLSNLLN